MNGSRGVVLFCGARAGNKPEYEIQARNLGAILADQDLRLVFGGGSLGLMGVVSKSYKEHGGEHLTGVIPKGLEAIEMPDCSYVDEIISVETMHQRKEQMYKRAGAAIVLPGGFGTFDEMFEFATWSQIGEHPEQAVKPIVLLNTINYFGGVYEQISRAVNSGFVSGEHGELMKFANSPFDAVQQLLSLLAASKKEEAVAA